ncbi:hypothetical protein [Sinomicrobium oceani]|uniref:hypothetical protein n=1 Tax=Sinomicrobium oceani TaxID=1150368 RepID=UPI00227B5884|nr:hypothetical protein [Sinomicrobium oceani]
MATFVFGFSQVLCSKQQTNTLPGQRERLTFGAPRSNNFPHKPLSLFIGKLFKHVPALAGPATWAHLLFDGVAERISRRARDLSKTKK